MHCRLAPVLCSILTLSFLAPTPHAAEAVSQTAATDYLLEIDPGQSDLHQPVLSFDLPQLGPDYSLTTSEGRPVPFQVDQNGRAWLVGPQIPAGQSLTLNLTPGPLDPSMEPELVASRPSLPAQPGLAVRSTGRSLQFGGTNLILEYQAEKSPLPSPDVNPLYKRGGYLHPLSTPSGRVITDDYPPNHLHHHGIWFPWTQTRFQDRNPDFWNMGKGEGTVEFTGLVRHWSGPIHSGFISRHRFLDLTASPSPVVALHEEWTVRVYPPASLDGRPFHMFDLISRQECATGDPLVLPPYHYGGLGFRGRWEWNGKDNTHFLTSEGVTDRVQGNETRGRWCYIGGQVDGEMAGVAILCHPENFRAPQPMRLHPNEPFFCYSPSQLGEWQILPGQPYLSRYRFILMDGAPEAAWIEKHWRNYAEPPDITVKKQKPNGDRSPVN